MSIRYGVNHDLVSISVDVSHGELGWHKDISFLFSQKNPTVNLTETSYYEHFIQWIPMMKNIKITN